MSAPELPRDAGDISKEKQKEESIHSAASGTQGLLL
jgi:hypothetical protein